MDASVSDDDCGTQHHCIFHSGYFVYRRTFQAALDLYDCVTVNIAHRQRTIMDTSLSDIIEEQNHYYFMMWNVWVQANQY